MTNEELKVLITDDFLSTLTIVAKEIGWNGGGLDYYVVVDFC